MAGRINISDAAHVKLGAPFTILNLRARCTKTRINIDVRLPSGQLIENS